MEFETNKTGVTEEDRHLANGERVSISPVHQDVQPPFDPDKARMHERSGTGATFEFDSETTAPAALASSASQKGKSRTHPFVIVVVAMVCALFVAGLIGLQNYF